MDGIPNLPRPYNILSLDGGGIKGVIEAVLLDRLEKEHPNVIRDTDLLVGTSTGGVITLALAAGKSPSEIQELFVEQSEKIFEDSLMDDLKDLWKLAGADYSGDNLRQVFQYYFGDMKLGDLDKKVAVVAFDLDNELQIPRKRTWKPKIFHNFEGPDSDAALRVADVALYTSAAPTYFPSVDGYIDGGVVANNPSMVGIIQALDPRHSGQHLEDLHLLSLGGGRMNRYIEGDDLDWGIVGWAPHLLYVLFEGAVEMVNFECQQLLGRRFHRLEPVLDTKVELDNWRSIPVLVQKAREEVISLTVGWLRENWK